MKRKIFIACDTSSLRKMNNILKNSENKNLKIGYKIGLEFFFSPNGRRFISKIKNREIFLDLKINDIPNTSMAAIKSLRDLRNINYLTVHINGGLEVLKAVKKISKKINSKMKIIGVTILTSFSNKSIKKIGHTKSIKDLVIKQARLAKHAGLDGIVCSGHEIKHIKKICNNMEIITPGIRLPGESRSDQKRILSPKQSFKNGASSIVMGRSLTKGNIKRNIQKLVISLK